jgi:hypothetical protein
LHRAVGPEASGQSDGLRGVGERFPRMMAEFAQQGADHGIGGAGGEGRLLRAAIEPGEPGVEPVFGVSKSRLRQGREQHLAQQPYAEQPLFGIGEAGEEPVEPAERQCAFALRERQLFGWDVGVGGEVMEALHAECVVNAKTLHNCTDGW